MNLRTSMLAVVALLVLAWDAEAQGRSAGQGRAPAVTYGSVERTKLLTQSAAKRGDARATYGSVERRAKLAGATVKFPRKLSETNGSLRTSWRRR